jgi:type VI secretion system secreted protein Hcp
MPAGTFDIFVKLDGIDGESTVRGHENETVVLSYEQSVDHPAPPLTGGAAATGRATFSGVRFRKPVDKGSIPLLLASAAGSHIRDARFTFRRPGTGLDFYKVILGEVLVTHVVQRAGVGVQYPLDFNTLTSGADSAGFLDEVTLSYTKIQWEYQPISPTGAPAAVVKGGWDLKLNKKI